MPSSSDSFHNSFDSHEPRQELDSPFLNEEYLVEEARIAQTWRTPVPRLQLESPFLQAFEEEWGAIGKPNIEAELEKEEFEESSVWHQAETFPEDDAEAQHYELLLELEDAESSYHVHESSVWYKAETFPEDDAEAQHYEMLLELEDFTEDSYDKEEDSANSESEAFSDDTFQEMDVSEEGWNAQEKEFNCPLEESTYQEESILDEEILIEPGQLSSLLNPGSTVQEAKRLLDEGVFSLSLLGRFASGKIWNEDHLALEILFHRQPQMRPDQWDVVSDSKRLKIFLSLAVKYQHELKPIREKIVRPLFGNPANFKVEPLIECQVQDLTLDVKKLGPLRGGEINGKVWYKRDAKQSPRRQTNIDSIVLHHMAYNIGNDVNLYKKVGAHYIVTADGQVAQLYDDVDFLNASNGFNPRSVAIEFAGNFPDHRYHWWKSREKTLPDRCYLTPTQIRAGRCLLARLKAQLPGIQYLYAHRQSSKSRENDPGPDVWFYIGEWALKNLGLTDREPQTHINKGQPIPEIWRKSRPVMPVVTAIPTPKPLKDTTNSVTNSQATGLIRFTQRVLNATEGERLDDDGDLGRFTRGALDRFRKKYNLGTGGILDDTTQLALAQRALEEIAQQSIFPKIGVLDTKTEQALIAFKSKHGLTLNAMLDAATRTTLANALTHRANTPSKFGPIVTSGSLPKLGAGLTPDPTLYRKFRLTTYYIVEQGELPTGAVRIPIYDDNGHKIAEGSPEFFAKLSLEGTARLTDGRLINVTGKKVPVSHNEYAEVLTYHKRAYARRDEKQRKAGKKPTPTQYSGIIVNNNRVVEALAFYILPENRRGIGYGVLRNIPLMPFRTLAADIGVKEKHEKNWKGKGGLVPVGTHVYIKEYDGLRLPDGTTHDGWFIVNDTGGGIFGAHFDVFVGTNELRKQVRLPEVGQVWFARIEQRIPPNYSYGLEI
jgi:peptidoglycan hydrolase-like protein with peptidoglycan-binding domain